MLARLAMRLCALEALRPTDSIAASGPWPTLAGAHVFDSRLDPIDDLQEKERRPIVVVYSDLHNLDRLAQAGGMLHKGVIDLAFEISVIAMERENDAYIAGLAFTDAELEADLDLLEEQIYFALHFAPSGQLFRKIAKGAAIDWQSQPHRTAEDGYRLAMRTIRAKFAVKEVCYDAALTAPATGLDRLPQPVRAIVQELAATSYGAALATGLAPKAPAMPVPDRLEGVTFEIDSKSPPAPQGADDPHVTASADNLQA